MTMSRKKTIAKETMTVTTATSATLSMSKSKTSKPKYAPIIATPPEPRTTVRATPLKPLSANEAKLQIKVLKASSEHTT
jgi:hypothetical protein